MVDESQDFDFRSLLQDAVDRLRVHETKETANSVFLEDKTLVGLIDLTRDLLEVFINNVKYPELV